MTAINKQITFRLAPFLAWYPAKFAAPKMKVSRRQHCIIVYAVKWRRAESEKEWRKGIRTSVSFWACRFRQWRDKTKAKRPKLLACWFTRIQQPCQTYLGVGQLLYALIWHKREQGTSPATPCSVLGLGHFVTLYVPTLPFRSTWKFVPWHEFEPATLLRLRHYGHGGYSSSRVRVAGWLAGWQSVSSRARWVQVPVVVQTK